jgi:hypothetical protein
MRILKYLLLASVPVAAAAGVLFAMGGLAGVRARYVVWQIGREPDDGIRAALVEGAAPSGVKFRDLLVDRLDDTRAEVRQRTESALTHMLKSPGGDGRAAHLLARIGERFPGFSPTGQEEALNVEWSFVSTTAPAAQPPGSLAVLASSLADAAQGAYPEIHRHAIDIASKAIGRTDGAVFLAASRELVRAGVRDDASEVQQAAIHLASHPAVRMLPALVPLLRDSRPEIRREALLAVGTAPDAIATDDLLEWLHDPDVSVRQTCEAALRGRGLRDDYLRLGRLLTDPDAATRLKVVRALRYTRDLEPGVWLRRLSHDAAPAVRAAAIRAAADHRDIDLNDRVEQIVQHDPSPTVRQVAQYYLVSRKPQP